MKKKRRKEKEKKERGNSKRKRKREKEKRMILNDGFAMNIRREKREVSFLVHVYATGKKK